jgi:multicomponent Na+:H+ antiporter subunit E
MKRLRKIPRFFRFALFYLTELLRANVRVAHDAVTPTHYMRPAMIAIPLDAETDFEILLLANLMTMTPGTVSVDISSDRRVLYLHAMYVEDVEAIRAEIKDQFERRVLRLLR